MARPDKAATILAMRRIACPLLCCAHLLGFPVRVPLLGINGARFATQKFPALSLKRRLPRAHKGVTGGLNRPSISERRLPEIRGDSVMKSTRLSGGARAVRCIARHRTPVQASAPLRSHPTIETPTSRRCGVANPPAKFEWRRRYAYAEPTGTEASRPDRCLPYGRPHMPHPGGPGQASTGTRLSSITRHRTPVLSPALLSKPLMDQGAAYRPRNRPGSRPAGGHLRRAVLGRSRGGTVSWPDEPQTPTRVCLPSAAQSSTAARPRQWRLRRRTRWRKRHP